MPHITSWLLAATFSILLLLSSKPVSGETRAHFEIEDSKSWIGIAVVKLSVSDLVDIDGVLTGEYEVKVPMMKSKNNKGRITIPIKQTIDQLKTNGGTIQGEAMSNTPGFKPSKIVCEILPQKGKTILLSITTEDRTIKFKSRFNVVMKTFHPKEPESQDAHSTSRTSKS